ncbi:hypothetical protein JL721_8236 [Aureococcus anophagefferens]|nr:hypothetical protein JL721_8236 [Aureococcus anophagefferens]
MCYRVIRDAKRRTSSSTKPRAEDDACPAYYGVDYREMRGALTCQFTVHEGTKTSGRKSAPADRTLLRHQRSRKAGKVMALASIPGVAKAGDGCIVFGLYDSKVEVSIQEKHRISEVVVARIEEHNVARAGAEKPLPPLHVAGACTSSAEFLSLFDESEVEMAAAMFDSRPIEIARPLLFESEEDAERRASRRAERSASRAEEAQGRRRRAAAAAAAGRRAAPRPTAPRSPRRARGARRGARAPPPTAPPVEAPAEAPAPAAAPAKKKKKKRSRRRPPRAEISDRLRAQPIATPSP